MSDQRILSLDEVRQLNRHSTATWITPSVRAMVSSGLPFPILPTLEPLPATITTLIVIGGGTLIDEAKVWRQQHAPDLALIAIPSIWGSGAEASPISVRNRDGKKDIRIDPSLLPDARAIWAELAATVSPARARSACGDCWAHSLEGFLSPLATPPLRIQLAEIIHRLLVTPDTDAAAWFEFSARACAGQAQSSVGLVHGIAHTLEGPLRASQPEADWSHAGLCSLFLGPVMRFNEQASDKSTRLLETYGISPPAIFPTLRLLFRREAYEQALPALQENWMSILRDPCSRTNCALVRPASLEFFLNLVMP